ncbi:TPA: hypothetical protein DIU27_04215 [Candidatus Collierbacteria bacterium]|uniref:Uncharacterized protein n=1 Tax=Candidatus Collierbacteria bacterium GW2011_GWB2_44_22 TaxID=1618387 RepID=A0A0G1HZ24_9BACT|nr:MAG: hypothetical protein UW31_C0001G0043 [Candidatus Collierbacteria bacterium GW2011_GWA2_44_13]KKT52190.1 MAG: hypothetical protein UW44_C0003G0033 [Candidatus Collierbacteria bacterium GW2011_GWB2_44_22]KKT62354.1 MAG: hypothetical protein UW56_C0008G0033 [Candidatus Collierbacteria bacterium GW2011_GWD1_44_27]KKT65903.1 MAG: hypothetical protein UW58_C0017G0035 [Candidatus Collierbacteria bacterium GW2011_GWC2_44_30]KKT69132.1 MAG: hypothetical protein UW64_C0004G0054 [Microgenomates gr
MKKPIRKVIDYLALSLLVSSAIILILIFNGNKLFQTITIISVSLIYIIWGVIHHLREHTFYPQIILEYVLFALLGCVIVIGLL